MARKDTEGKLTYRALMCMADDADQKISNVAHCMFLLGRKCRNAAEFIANCETEERWIQSADAGKRQRTDLPDVWTQKKSDVKRALEMGIDLSTVPSYHKMRQAKTDLNKEIRDEVKTRFERNSATRTNTQRKETDIDPATTVSEALASGDVVDSRSTQLVPPELAEFMKYYWQLESPLQQSMVAKKATKLAMDSYSLQCQNQAKSRQHEAPPKRGGQPHTAQHTQSGPLRSKWAR